MTVPRRKQRPPSLDWYRARARGAANAAGPPLVQMDEIPPPRWPQKAVELPLRTPLGGWLERWEQARKIEKLQKRLTTLRTI